MTAFLLSVLTLFILTTPAVSAEENEPVFEIIGGVVQGEEEETWVPEGWKGEFTLGGAGVALSRPSFKFGEYSGIEESGGYIVAEGEFNYFRENRFLNFYADNLGLDNRKIALEYGKTNDYKIFGQWDQTPHLLFSQNQTPFAGAGGSRLTLPAGFPRASSFVGSSIPTTPVELKVDTRNEAEVGAIKSLGPNQFELQFKRIEKNGLRSLGGTVGGHPAVGRSIILPAPIDFHTNEVRASFSHKAEKANIRLSYFGSFFDNRQDSLVFDNPFAGNVNFFDGTPFGVGPLNTQGRLSLEPDNQFHQLRVSGGWNPSDSTRLTATAEYGIALQDQMLQPFAIGSSRALLPRQTAEAQISNLLIRLQATTSITPKLKLAAKFRHFQIDNRTPRNLFQIIVNDLGTQRPIGGDQAIFNLPVEYSKNQGNLDLSYRVLDATYLKLGYQILHKDHEFRSIDESLENRISLGISSNELGWMSTTANLTYARVDTDPYKFETVRTLHHTSQFLNGPGGPLLASPSDFRKKDIAESGRLQSSVNLSFFPTDSVMLGLSHNWIQQEFPKQFIGLQSVQTHSATIDITHTPTPTLSYSAFFTYESNQIDQDGRAHNFLAPGSINDSTRNYMVMLDDDSYTAGVSSDWSLLNDQVHLKADYSVSQNESDINFTAGTNPAVANPVNLPAVKTLHHQLGGTAEYNISRELTVGMRARYENFSFDDFALDSHNPQTPIPPTSVSNGEVVLLSNTIQDYEAYTGMMYVTYRFQSR